MKRLLALLLFSAMFAFAAPVITTGKIYNAASNIPLGMQGSGIAQGSYFVIFGSGLGPPSLSVAPSLNFQTSLSGVTVSVTTSGAPPVQAYLYYVRADQIAGILPSNTKAGPAALIVTYNGVPSEPAKITVVPSNFGIFTRNQAGSGPAAILNIRADGSSDINSFTNSAADNQVMSIYGTGLGAILVPDNIPPGAVSPNLGDIRVLVGNQSVIPSYAGRSPAFPGLDQINFQIPPGTPDGCFIPIAAQLNHFVSNYATFSKSPTGGSCTSVLSSAALQRFDAGGAVTVAQLGLSRSLISASLLGFNLNIATEQAGGVFAPLNFATLFGVSQTPGALPPLTPDGTCLVQTIDSVSPPTSTVPPVASLLNAGTLTLSGPNNKTQTVNFTAGTGYLKGLAQSGAIPQITPPGVPTVPAGSPSGYLDPGQWTIQGSGGPDIGPFTASLTLPAPFNCTNCAGITTIDRTHPLTINWTGGGGAQDYVQVIGSATTPSLVDPNKNVAVLFSCSTKASDGTLTVPPEILSQLPTSLGDLQARNVGTLAIISGMGLGDAGFTAPLAAGGNLDLGYFGYTSLQLKPVGFN